MTAKFWIGGALALASVAAIAQMPTEKPGSADPARVSGGTYTADPNHTLVGWTVDHLGFSDYFGLFGDVTGTLILDKADPARSKLDVTIPIKPVTASAGLNEHLVRPGKDGGKPDFFGPDQAAARYVSTSVQPSADGMGAYILGNLTLNGVTKPVAIQARFTGAGAMRGTETVGFSGRALIRRSDFGINGALPLVSDEVELNLTAAFEKEAGEPQARPDPGPNACNADKVQPWIGKAATPAVRTAVGKATGAGTIRWLYPDSIVTKDYRVERLNVSIDKGSDIIRSARCG
ncbi:I78 family peptidase inhibitor [Tsuneonella amylolytica]|uniref:I78 family peptidase inhibitor n=1 Tax=Tsuneonella amylolytica TaxID=2338327 RepID=UPI000EA871E1|nr:I78 family peptidase inhibitor [Tsuneonella amylolytica]